MLPGLMPVPVIVGLGGSAVGGTGTPIGLLLSLTRVISTGSGVTGTPIGLLITLTREIPAGGGGSSTAGQSAGLLLALTKAS
jgi:hypothetical protein